MIKDVGGLIIIWPFRGKPNDFKISTSFLASKFNMKKPSTPSAVSPFSFSKYSTAHTISVHTAYTHARTCVRRINLYKYI
jgi:hypothetical protein